MERSPDDLFLENHPMLRKYRRLLSIIRWILLILMDWI